MKVIADGAVRAAVTFKVTGTLSCPLALPQEAVGVQVKSTAPVYVPVAKPARLIDTVSLPGVEPLGGETSSQPAGVLEATALYEMAVPLELVIANGWLAGTAPALEVKVSEGDPDTITGRNVRLTVTEMGVLLGAVGVTLIVPLVFAVSAPTFTETVGPPPLVLKVPGVTESQALPLVTAAL